MNNHEILRKIPQVNEIIKNNVLIENTKSIPHDFLVSCVRETLIDVRASVIKGKSNDININDIINKILNKVEKKSTTCLRRIINATGTVLHTNLGRSILSKKSIQAMSDVASNYSNLEYDVKTGCRGNRQNHIEKIISDITGAEAAMVVNNNAAATILVLAALAENKEVIISRGELIEIGDSFRLPSVMEESKALLKEIGSTNKTRIDDYKNAIDENITAAILKAHTSNYRIVGFTEQVELNELVSLGNAHNIPVIYDMGNGLMVDLNEYGINEPTVKNLVKNGADIVLFSGDKLLGGPQAGIIIGKAKYISKMRKHPIARAIRVDKFTLAALHATFFEYYDEKQAKINIPTLRMITIEKNELKNKANIIANAFKEKLSNSFDINIEEVKDQVGGGTAPDVFLDGYAVSIYSKDVPSEKIERLFRTFSVPIIVRVSHDKIYIDVRTIQNDDVQLLINEIVEGLNSK